MLFRSITTSTLIDQIDHHPVKLADGIEGFKTLEQTNLVVNAVTYTPTANLNGSDSFTVVVRDKAGEEAFKKEWFFVPECVEFVAGKDVAVPCG